MTSYLVGIDLGGTNIKGAIAEQGGSILAEESIPTESHLGPADVITRIGDLVERLSQKQNVSVNSIGIGVPGLVDVQAGVTKFLPNLETQWRDIPIAEQLTKRLNCPVRILNDVRTATLGELHFGHGKDRSNISLAFFSLGTGVGGGIVIDGKLRLGPSGAAGELGHQTMIPDGKRCGCGNRGCLETIASGPAIAAEGVRLLRMGLAPKLHQLVNGDANKVTTREMVMAATEDKTIHEAIVNAATYIGIAASNVVVCLYPDLIILGGGVAEIGTLLTDTVQQVIRERVGMFPPESIQVLSSQLGDKAGVMGAIALARGDATDK